MTTITPDQIYNYCQMQLQSDRPLDAIELMADGKSDQTKNIPCKVFPIHELKIHSARYTLDHSGIRLRV